MSKFLTIQTALAEALKAHPGLPAKLEVIARRSHAVANNIEAALGKLGICLYVLPPMPKRATRTECAIVFLESVEIRIRIIEQPQLNLTGTDAWDAMEQVILAIQGTNPGALFACPLTLSSRPVEDAEDKTTRVFDVIFDAAFQLQ